MDEHVEHHKKEGNDALYAIAIAIILSVIILSGVIVYAAGSMNANLQSLNTNIANLKLNVNVQGAGQELQGTPTPTIAPTAVPQPGTINLEGLPFKGSANAKITIVEYSDFQCPYCKMFVEGAYPQIIKEWIDTGKAKMYFKHYPLTELGHTLAPKAAEAAECASDQGKFWEMHDKMFAGQPAIAVADLKKYAGELKLDTAKFNECLDSGKKAGIVDAQKAEGSALGVTGTPNFFINGQKVPLGASPYASFKQVLDQAEAAIG
ncbi:MAG: thioredoxin domain-containing protein [Candidatus Micrarchaeota archaeon]